MMKRWLLAVSVLALTSGGVFAQSNYQSPGQSPAMPPAPSPATPPAQSPAMPPAQSPAMPPAQSPAMPPPASTGSPGTGTMGQAPKSGAMSPSYHHAATMGNSSAVVRKAQQTLKRDGLYKGKVDGIFGPETRTAVARFQKRNGLKQTAKLDRATLTKLKESGS